MLIIGTQDLATEYVRIPNAQDIVRRDGVLELADGEDSGWLLTPPISPTMAIAYQGFDLLPMEQGIRVAVRRPFDSWCRWLAGQWVSHDTPTYYTAGQLRDYLVDWVGEIQFQIEMTRGTDGRSPQLRVLRVAYEVMGDFLHYLIEWALVPWCRMEVPLIRNAMTRDGITVGIPERLNPAQISSIKALKPGERLVEASLLENPVRILLANPVTPGMVQLQFRYAPVTEHVTGMFQVEEVPVVLLRLLQGENYRRVNTTDWVRTSGDRAKIWHCVHQYDQPVEIEVLAHSFDDARSIAQMIAAQVDTDGFLVVQAYGLTIYIRMRSPIQPGETLQQEGNLFSLKFRISLLGLTNSDYDTEVLLTTEYIRDFEPINR